MSTQRTLLATFALQHAADDGSGLVDSPVTVVATDNGPGTRSTFTVARAEFGQPSAAKRGRTAARPYVPIIAHPSPTYGTRTEQIKGRAFATRDEAVEYARSVIAARRTSLAERLARPEHRALRAQHGLS